MRRRRSPAGLRGRGMDRLLIRGGRRLHGEVPVSGAKNAALPQLCAALLSAEPVTLLNMPRLQDVSTMLRLLRHMGVGGGRPGDGPLRLHGRAPHTPQTPPQLVQNMPAPGPENFLLAATLAEGETVLENAAQEPEIADLAEMLIAMGAQIEGHGSSRIRIQGVERLHGCSHRVVADRIEAGTFLCAVAATGGDVLLRHGRADHLDAVIEKLRAAGADVQAVADGIRVQSPGGAKLKAQGFRTTEYPGFPTDMQAQFMALDCIAQGTATVTETIFENRFMHVDELLRLGSRIQVDGKVAVIEGQPRLSGATVMATDLRASACLVIAGLVAEGQTAVERIYHLDRGYDCMEAKLPGIGADIERVPA